MMFRLLLLLWLLPAAVYSQAPGHLGRDKYVLWNAYSFPSLRYEQIPSLNWNVRNEVSGGWAFHKYAAVEVTTGLLTTTTPYDSLFSPVLNTGNKTDETYIRLNSYFVGAKLKVFIHQLGGSYAPTGLYGALGYQHHWALAFEPDASGGNLRVDNNGYRMGWLKASSLQLEVGNHVIINERYILDLGMQTALSFATEFRTLNDIHGPQARKELRARLFNHLGFNLKVGFGYLL